jgi:hypothetical protein
LSRFQQQLKTGLDAFHGSINPLVADWRAPGKGSSTGTWSHFLAAWDLLPKLQAAISAQIQTTIDSGL